MLTPEQIQKIADTMFPMLDDLNARILRDMIKRLAARIGRGEQAMLGATDEWHAQVYQEAGGLLEDVEKEIQRFLQVSDAEVARIFEDAAIKSLEADNRVYVGAGAQKRSISPAMLRVLQDTYQRTNGTIHNFTRTTATETQKEFIRLLDEAHLRVYSGAGSYTQAVSDVVRELSEYQMRVVYPSGHVDTIEVAVLRAVRTGTAQAAGNMSLTDMEERDWDLIRVSAHIGARYGDGGENPGNHFWWQGKLYSRSGRDKRYPPFVKTTGYGIGEGLCGWNCRHSFGPGDPNHNPYKDFDAEENKEAYDLSQRQREMERRIRHTKTKLIALREGIDATEDAGVKASLETEYARTAKLLERQNEAYNKFCDDNNLKRLLDRIQVAKWTRADAKKSMMAVKEDSPKNGVANPAGRGIMRPMGENAGLTAEQARKATLHEETYGADAVRVDLDYIRSNEYRMKFHGITGNHIVDDKIAEYSRAILESRTGTRKETLILLDKETGNQIASISDSNQDNAISYNSETEEAILAAKAAGKQIISIHNHPEGYPPTADDCVSALNRGYQLGIVCGHNGAIYTYAPASDPLTTAECERLHEIIGLQCYYEPDLQRRVALWVEIMEENGLHVRKWG